MSENSSLSPKQRKAIAALLSAENIEGAATIAGVASRTVYRWLHDDELFKAELRASQDAAIAAAISRLSGEVSANVATLVAIRDNPEVSPSVQLQAAQQLSKMLLELREHHDLAERVALLEERISA